MRNISSIKQIRCEYESKIPIYMKIFINNYFDNGKQNDLLGLQECFEVETDPEKMTYRECPLEKFFKRKMVINYNGYYFKNSKQMFMDVNYYKMFV